MLAWTPILGQHCANAVALYWANEQTALGLCWMPMLAHHCRQYQHWPYIQLHWALLGFPYWANISAPMQWPYIGPMAMSKLHWAYVGCQCWPIIAANIGPILDQHCPYIQLHWAMLGFPYWANIAPMQWPYIGPMSKLHWANVGPSLPPYTTTLGHAWLPILGQHCANAVALYWANEQTALCLCWVLMLAHHCCQYGPILDQYWLAGWVLIKLCNAQAFSSYFHKMAAGAHIGWLKITFDRISRHFRSIRNFYFFGITFHKLAAILYNRKSLLIAFLAISDKCTQLFNFLKFFHKMAAGAHFWWLKITFDRISRHFR